MKDKCYKGWFWNMESQLFERWEEVKCRKGSQETAQETTKHI